LMKNSNLEKKRKRSEMTVKERVQDFQRKLYRKAKQTKDFRFYVLYDKICLIHFLEEAYRRVKANGGSPGVDNVTFEQIEERDRDFFLSEIREELQKEVYKPSPVKEVMIPKANGKLRPLGIPTIKDRVVQMSCKMVIEPIFEADFEETSYGFRPKRSAKDAIAEIKKNLKANRAEVYDADLSNYFGTIPHGKLLTTIGLRISDKKVIHLIKLWLKAPIEKDGKVSGGKKNRKGTPQGGVISPLLSNIYLHWLDKSVNNPNSIFSKCGTRIIRYADDFVLMGRYIPEEVLGKLKNILGRLELEINDEKSKIVDAKETAFDFLGFTFRRDWSVLNKNDKYWNVIPSEKSCKKIRKTIKDYLAVRGHFCDKDIAKGLNAKLRGWLNYFIVDGTSYTAKAKCKLRCYLHDRIFRFYRRKSQRVKVERCYSGFKRLVEYHGLIDPIKYKYTVKA